MKARLNTVNRLIIVFVLCVMAVTTIYPLIFMLINSFKIQSEYLLGPLLFPKQISLANYKIMYSSYKIVRLFNNSLVIVSLSIFFEIFLCSLAAYAFAKSRFKGKGYLFLFFISMMIIPFQVLMLPLYIMFARLNLINTKLALIIIYTATLIPFALYFLTTNFRTIPDEIIESARIDGASYFRIYWSIILPIGRSAMITLFILDFVWLWNELVLALIFLQSDETKTITAGVATILGRYSSNQPLMLTGLLLSSLPTIIIYTVVAKYLMKGITVGAVKG
jgi:raffinose/stachyose/melibiose transport system permease protein